MTTQKPDRTASKAMDIQNGRQLRLRKKLIEVALPLTAINEASAQEKGNPFIKGHPRNLHQWWARRPLAAARAIVFSQLVDDPSSWPELFPTAADQEKERLRLFRLIEDMVPWDRSSDETVFQRAEREIKASWERTCSDNQGHAEARQIFNPRQPLDLLDPFAGGGAIPLEAQRLGLHVTASDLNPVAVVINKALVEIPGVFGDQSPVNPSARKERKFTSQEWRGSTGIAEDVLHYGTWLHEQLRKSIGPLYPQMEVTDDVVRDRPDLRQLKGSRLNVIAWLWTRTVRSPNPAFAHVHVPLASTFMLSTKAGKEAYIEPLVVDGDHYKFRVCAGKPQDPARAKSGTKLARGANFRCLMSGVPISPDYIYGEGKAGRLGTRLLAIVAEAKRGRVYLSPTVDAESVASSAAPTWKPDLPMPENPRWFSPPLYGLTTYGDIFTPRQLVALTSACDLMEPLCEMVMADCRAAGLGEDGRRLEEGGRGARAYADAIAIYMALCIDKLADYSNTLCTWNPINQNIGHLFTKQAIPMTWDFPECSPIEGGLSFDSIVDGVARTVALLPGRHEGHAIQRDCAAIEPLSNPPVISTDPPYYDNIGYADLSDFFYVWLRRSVRHALPTLFGTVATPKGEELVATPYRHGGKLAAEEFFMSGMSRAMRRLAEVSHPAFPVTIYYAFKQSETKADEGTASTGWETFLQAVVEAGFSLTGTWPIRTERVARSVGLGTNALASSIILVCRPRRVGGQSATKREFVASLKSELPDALAHLQRGNIAPVDLAQAAIGPGMAVFTRFSKVLDAEGRAITVRDALATINQVLDEVLAAQEGEFDVDSRWALAWFEQFAFDGAPFGIAETLSKAKNTSIGGLVEAGIVASRAGKVRLLRPEELASDWDPAKDSRLTVWESVHHLIRSIDSGGEPAGAALLSRLGGAAEAARDLAYRLYVLCERRKWVKEAGTYNALVVAWPELERLAAGDSAIAASTQTAMFDEDEEV